MNEKPIEGLLWKFVEHKNQRGERKEKSIDATHSCKSHHDE
jgi:hypothetical protein